MAPQRRLLGSVIAALLVAASGWLAMAARETPPTLSQAMVLSVSEDGRYVISSHRERELVLWDIEARAHRVISREANLYSAYFIPGRDAFLWQDLQDIVRVQRVNGTVLQAFTHFPTYGHRITPDLRTYVSSDVEWGLYIGHGEQLRRIKDDGDSPSFMGIGKLLNLDVVATTPHLLLSSGDGDTSYGAGPGYDDEPIEAFPPLRPEGLFSFYAGVVLWDLTTGQPLHKLPGNSAKTHATLSPDGKFVVSVDENGKSFVWKTSTGMRPYRPSTLGSGIFIPSDTGLGDFDPAGMRLTYPADFPPGFSGSAQLGVHFLDAEHYVILHTYHSYAVLYTLGDPFALQILPLGEDPFPSVSSYSRNAAIDSAPKAGILVTGQREGGGINVYRFDSHTRSLERIWAPTP